MSNVPSENSFEQNPTRESKEGRCDQPVKGDLSPDFTALIDAIKREAAANRSEEQREDSGKKLREWVTIVLIGCTLVAVSWQVYEMIQVYGPIKDQADAAAKQAVASDKAATATLRAAEATTKAADAAVKQSEIAAKQAETSERAAIQAQRAWVGPRDAKLESKPTVGQKNKIIIEYHNTGKEPALGFRFDATPSVATVEEDGNGEVTKRTMAFMDRCTKLVPMTGSGVTYPSSGFSANNLTVPIEGTLIDDDVASGKKFIIVNGCFVYQTGNVARYSTFCYFYKDGLTEIGHLAMCFTGNFAN